MDVGCYGTKSEAERDSNSILKDTPKKAPRVPPGRNLNLFLVLAPALDSSNGFIPNRALLRASYLRQDQFLNTDFSGRCLHSSNYNETFSSEQYIYATCVWKRLRKTVFVNSVVKVFDKTKYTNTFYIYINIYIYIYVYIYIQFVRN